MITKKTLNSERDKFHIQREIDIHSKLRHPHIISVYEGLWKLYLWRLLLSCHLNAQLYAVVFSYTDKTHYGICNFAVTKGFVCVTTLCWFLYGMAEILIVLHCCCIAVYETESTVTFVMEYASGGELFDYINSQSDLGSSDGRDSGSLGGLSEGEARQFFSQLVSAVQFLHEVHRCPCMGFDAAIVILL